MASLFLCINLMLFSGTIASISNKILFDLRTDGRCQNNTFTKPYFMTLAMFIGEAFCLVYYYYLQYKRNKLIKKAIKQQNLQQPFPETLENNSHSDSLNIYVQSNFDEENDDQIYNQSLTKDTTREPLLSPVSKLKSDQSIPFFSDHDDAYEQKHLQDQQSLNNHLSSNSFDQLSRNGKLSLTSAQSNFSVVRPLSSQTPLWIFALLSCFDLSATAISGVGLEFISASTNQMLRGSSMVFVALFSIPLLRFRPSLIQSLSICIVVIALILVGLSGMLRGEAQSLTPAGSHSNLPVEPSDNSRPVAEQIFGCFLVLLGTAINSIQNVLEEKLMKNEIYKNVSPLEIVGWEGVFGSVITASILLPIAQSASGSDCDNRAENTVDSFYQLSNRPILAILIFSYIISLAILNFTAMEISRLQSAVHRNLLGSARIIMVWVVSILLFYISKALKIPDNLAGEQLDQYSLLQAFGFIVLATGTYIYSTNKVPNLFRKNDSDGRLSTNYDVNHPNVDS